MLLLHHNLLMIRRGWGTKILEPGFQLPCYAVYWPQTTMSEGPAQGPYVAARAEIEPPNLRLKGVDSTNGPLRRTNNCGLASGLKMKRRKSRVHYFIQTTTSS